MGRFSKATNAKQSGGGDYPPPGEWIVEIMKVIQFESQNTGLPCFVVEYKVLEVLLGGKRDDGSMVEPGAIQSQFINMTWRSADGAINHFFNAVLPEDVLGDDGTVPEEAMEVSVGVDQPLEGAKLGLRTYHVKKRSDPGGDPFTKYEWKRLAA